MACYASIIFSNFLEHWFEIIFIISLILLMCFFIVMAILKIMLILKTKK